MVMCSLYDTIRTDGQTDRCRDGRTDLMYSIDAFCMLMHAVSHVKKKQLRAFPQSIAIG